MQGLFFIYFNQVLIMEIKYNNNQMTIRDIDHFSLEQCLCCGQAFRWRPRDGGFVGIALGREVLAVQDGAEVTLYGVDKQSGPAFIRYFDLERDYGTLKSTYTKDPFLRQGMEFAHGIRVLRQDPFETLISFIISANNNVSRIMGIIEKLCMQFGKPLQEEKDFPTPKVLASLSVDDVKACGAGYRARYIIETARMVCDGFDVYALANLSYEDAKQQLTTLPGVGPKVADCVALYSLGFTQAFPADVWMKRVLCGVYDYNGKNDKQLREFIDKKFGRHAGIAQQYLFHYARNNKETVRKP